MTNKKEHWYNHGWAIAIGSVVLTLVLPTLWDIIKSLPFLTTSQLIAKYIYNFFDYNFKLWWILLSTFIVLSAKYIYPHLRALLERDQTTTIKTEVVVKKAGDKTHFDYTGDKFDGYYWKWVWDRNPVTKKISPQRITPTCNMIKCNLANLTDVSFDNTQNRYKCSNCGKFYYGLPSNSYIEERILEKVINHDF